MVDGLSKIQSVILLTYFVIRELLLFYEMQPLPCVPNNADDEYEPVWPSGLWATSQGDETSKAYNRTQ